MPDLNSLKDILEIHIIEGDFMTRGHPWMKMRQKQVRRAQDLAEPKTQLIQDKTPPGPQRAPKPSDGGGDKLLRTFYQNMNEVTLRLRNQDNSKLIILLDNNVGYALGKYLSAQGFHVLTSFQVSLRRIPDYAIALAARRNGVLIFTHDQDFGKFNKHPLSKSGGVVELPMTQYGDAPTLPIIEAALEHFCKEMPREASAWFSKFARYDVEGNLTVYSLRPGQTSGEPAVETSSYFPQP